MPQPSTATVRPPASSAPRCASRVDSAREAADDHEPGCRQLAPEQARDLRPVRRAGPGADDRHGRLRRTARPRPSRVGTDPAAGRGARAAATGNQPRSARRTATPRRQRRANRRPRRTRGGTARSAARAAPRRRAHRSPAANAARARSLTASRAPSASGTRAPPRPARCRPPPRPRAQRSFARRGRRAHGLGRTAAAARRRGSRARLPRACAAAASPRAAARVPSTRSRTALDARRGAASSSRGAWTRHRDHEVEPVEQRPRELVPVRGEASRGAGALGRGIAARSARTEVHRRHELEARREDDLARRPARSRSRRPRAAGAVPRARCAGTRPARRGSSTPRCARLASPGRGDEPPPTIAADRGACGAARETAARTRAAAPAASSPATEWIRVTSSASSGGSRGRIPGSRRASIVLPVPGGPPSSRL